MRTVNWYVVEAVIITVIGVLLILWVAYDPNYCVNYCVRHGGAYEECERSCHKLLED